MKKKFKIIAMVSVCLGILLAFFEIFSKRTQELDEELSELELDENDEDIF